MKKLFLLLFALWCLLPIRARAVSLMDITQPADSVLMSSLPGYIRGVTSVLDLLIGTYQWTPVTISASPEDSSSLLVDTSLVPCTITLPPNPNVGTTISLLDPAHTWEINQVVLVGNGSKIMGSASNYVLSSVPYEQVVYYNNTLGWIVSAGPAFDPTNPGTIGGNTPAPITGTSITANSSIVDKGSLSVQGAISLSVPLPVAGGGTGGNTVLAAMENLLSGGLNTPGPVSIGTTYITANTLAQLTADANFAGTVYLTAPVTLTANLTLTCDLRPVQGAIITTNGYTLDLMGNFTPSGAYQCFNTSPGGVVLAIATLTIDVEWFGAVADNNNSSAAKNYNAIASAFASEPNSGIGSRIIKFASDGIYYTTGGLVWPVQGTIEGCGPSGISRTIIRVANNDTNAYLFTNPGHGTVGDSGLTIRNLQIDGNRSNGATDSLIYMSYNMTYGTNNITLDHLYLYNSANYGLYASWVADMIVNACAFVGNTYGTYTTNCTGLKFYGCDWVVNGAATPNTSQIGYDIDVGPGADIDGVYFSDCWWENNSGQNILNNVIIEQQKTVIHGCYLRTDGTISFPILLANTAANCHIDDVEQEDTTQPTVTRIPFVLGTKSPTGGTGVSGLCDTIAGNTSGATGKVGMVQIQSGSWTAGNATGTLYLYDVTGTFQNSEHLNDTTASYTDFASTGSNVSSYPSTIGPVVGINQGSINNFMTNIAGNSVYSPVIDGNGSSYIINQQSGGFWQKSGRVFENAVPLDNTGTPDVSRGNYFTTTGSTTITNFINSQPGQEITIYFAVGCSIANNANIVTTTGGTISFQWPMVARFMQTGANWQQISALTPGALCSGTVPLFSGSATVTNGCIAGTRPVVCTDQTAIEPVKCTPSSGSLSVGGTGSDVISWAQQ